MSTLISAAGSSSPRARTDPRLTVHASHAVYAQALVRHFDGLRAVDEVELRIPAGEIYGFLGPNGAGKPITRLGHSVALPQLGRSEPWTALPEGLRPGASPL